jgi:uncharacterized membrane protein
VTGVDGALGRLSPTDRVEAFTDAVLAIAITLLVLEIRVPDEDQVAAAGSLWRALAQEWPAHLSYLATFLNVGVIWLNHHAGMAKVARVDRTLLWWNLGLLLTVSFTPFPNALVAEHLRDGLATEPARTATVVYALAFTASTVPWVFIWGHLARHPQLLEPGYDRGYALRERRRAVIGVAAYACGVPVALAAPLAAVLLFIAAALFYAVTATGSRSPARS